MQGVNAGVNVAAAGSPQYKATAQRYHWIFFAIRSPAESTEVDVLSLMKINLGAGPERRNCQLWIVEAKLQQGPVGVR